MRFGAGDCDQSAAANRSAAEHSRALGRSVDAAVSEWGLADALRALGKWSEAAEAAEPCRTLAIAEDIPEVAADACLILAKALYWMDREKETLTVCVTGRDH